MDAPIGLVFARLNSYRNPSPRFVTDRYMVSRNEPLPGRVMPCFCAGADGQASRIEQFSPNAPENVSQAVTGSHHTVVAGTGTMESGRSPLVWQWKPIFWMEKESGQTGPDRSGFS